MQYSKLTALPRSRELVTVFGGYNHNLRIGAGEFYDMTNLTGRYYPLLAPRPRRGFYTGGGNITALLAKDRLCYADGSDLVVGTVHYDLGLSGDPETSLLSMGAYIIVLPDRKYLNTADPQDRGDIDASFTAENGVSLSLSPLGEADYSLSHTGPAAPQSPDDGAYWLDTGADSPTLKQFSADSGLWNPVTAVCTRISAPGIGAAFGVGDGVTVSGIPGLEGSHVIEALGTDYLLIPGLRTGAVETPVTVCRTMPLTDFVIEAGNRLWGCRYGLNAEGKPVNELYASKLGDFKNWNCFRGLSTDSYAVSLGSDGPFTGAITHLGCPLFFKEGQLHKVYGPVPSGFQIQSDACRGVQRGSGKSLAIVGETLYYKSRLGVCAYDGSLPREVSRALGEEPYRSAAAGSHGDRYYISMADGAGRWHLFVYDTARDLWHREDDTRVLGFASYDNELYFLDGADRQIKTVFGTGSAPYAAPVRWSAETGLLGVEDPDRKYISCIQLRLRLELNSEVQVYLEYDSSGAWEYAGTLRGAGTGTCTLPIRPRRCDHLRLKLEGRGDMRLFSIARTLQEGGAG